MIIAFTAVFLQSTNREIGKGKQSTEKTQKNHLPNKQKMRFPTISHLLLTLTALALANPVPGPNPNEDDNFQLLAREADEIALHAALHARKEYKHGIFPHDRHALEAVRREHAEEALKIVKFALLRRDNSTTATHDTDSTTKTTIHTTDLTTTHLPATTNTKTEASTTTTASSKYAGTTTTSPLKTETSTTTRTTVVTNDEGQPTTVTQTDLVIITPTPTTVHASKTTTTSKTFGLQTANAAGQVELGWVKVGAAVMAGVGGLVL